MLPANKPIFVINYKAYETSYGHQALLIAKASEKAELEFSIKTIIAVPFTEIWRISKEVSIDVIAQHVDPIIPGQGTGFITAEMIAGSGGKGSILNHSEHKLKIFEIEKGIERLKLNNLYSIVCAETPRSSLAVANLGADIVAMEPPDLIGTGVSVSKSKPELVTKTVEKIRNSGFKKIPILVGAGIVDKEDARKAIKLGADGILVSSIIMKSKEPEKKIFELAEGLNSLNK
ncbi:triose-phosphate isomerase [Fervidicoccus fontis]|uniref:Triosephosphate isomerase n=1 Tax=Fervidicoccus fontis (strain DSM 19380 / JCM 18336 / VKM B-2539 / Kam940) TaxID=1163730 RepID=I0A1N1_FERFK|nr:triose-phosphate isomerase [Fervidicoccus fontis]AFH42888.1 triosephosphate isomerase [Fervidicoccus fontis Kam940]